MDEVERAQQEVRRILGRIATHRWINLWVPHGFSVEDVESELRRNPFAEDLPSVRVTAFLDMPVVYRPKNGRAHTADRTIVETLHAWIQHEAEDAFRLELLRWDVEPNKDPTPRGDPNGPDQRWTVKAIFEAN
jgi:hypothetical protein